MGFDWIFRDLRDLGFEFEINFEDLGFGNSFTQIRDPRLPNPGYERYKNHHKLENFSPKLLALKAALENLEILW